MKSKPILKMLILALTVCLAPSSFLVAHDTDWGAWNNGGSMDTSCMYSYEEIYPGVFEWVFDGDTRDCDYSPSVADNVRILLNAHYHKSETAKTDPGRTRYYEAEEYGLWMTDDTKAWTVPNLSKKRKSCRRTRVQDGHKDFIFDVASDFMRQGETYYVEVEYLNDEGGDFLIEAGSTDWTVANHIAQPPTYSWTTVVRSFTVPATGDTSSARVRLLENTLAHDLYVRSVALYRYDPEDPPSGTGVMVPMSDFYHFEVDAPDAAQTAE